MFIVDPQYKEKKMNDLDKIHENVKKINSILEDATGDEKKTIHSLAKEHLMRMNKLNKEPKVDKKIIDIYTKIKQLQRELNDGTYDLNLNNRNTTGDLKLKDNYDE